MGRCRLRPSVPLLAALAAIACLLAWAPGVSAASATFSKVSADGSKVLFTTTEQLVPSDTDTRTDVYARVGANTSLVSANLPVAGNGPFNAFFAGASADGTHVFFSTAEPLVAADTDSSDDVYERFGGQTTLVSTSATALSGPFPADLRAVSSDGQRAVFSTRESLSPADTDTSADLYERTGGVTTLISTGLGGNANADVQFRGASADASVVFFVTVESLAPADADNSVDIYQHTSAGTDLVSTGTSGGNGAFDVGFGKASGDGSAVFFETSESLTSTDTDAAQDVYRRSAGVTTLVSSGVTGGNGSFDASLQGLSADGAHAFFRTAESLSPADTDGTGDIYENAGGTTTLVSTGPAGGNGGQVAQFSGSSADGSRVFFTTDEPLLAADSDATADIYERTGGTTTLTSVGDSDQNGPADVSFSDVSSDGSSVVFSTVDALTSDDADASRDLFTRAGGTTTLSSANLPFAGSGPDNAGFVGATPDGSEVLFETTEHLTADDTDVASDSDIFARSGGTTILISGGGTVSTGTGPDATITSGPSGPTNSGSTSFTFTTGEAGATFECRLDAAAFTPCTSPQAYTGLSEGPHAFRVRAVDDLGNPGTADQRNFTVDTIAPDTIIDSGPSGPTAVVSPSFTFHSAEAGSTFECSLDGGIYGACSSPRGYGPLAEGPHTFSVRATDLASNTDATPDTRNFTIDITAPDTTIDTGPSGLTSGSIPTYTFSSPDGTATFQCRVDGAAFTACTSPFTTTALADGSHTFAVRAVDPAGNVDATPATRTILVDTTAPDTTINFGPQGPTSNPTPSFTFSSEAGATFECRIDAAAFAACTSPFTAPSLADGAHSFSVRATDSLGNTGTASSRSFTVDTTAPDTTITSSTVTGSSASVSFTSPDAGAGFECKLDSAPYAPCTSLKTYSGLSAGDHAFSVRATDAAGNTDQTPATATLTVATVTPPDTTIDSAPAALTNNPAPSFSFSSSENYATFECKLDGPGATTGTYGACTNPRTYSGLADGAYTFSVRSISQGGTTDSTPATSSFTLDATPPDTIIDTGRTGAGQSTSATFTFHSTESGSTLECRLDGAAFTPCSSPQAHSSLADGSHTFDVRAIDSATNIDLTPATNTFIVDTTPPDTTVDTGPSGRTVAAFPTFGFSSNEPGSTFECSTDGGAFAGCTSPTTIGRLSDGPHTFEVRATDLVGLTDPTPALRSITVDTTGPPSLTRTDPASPSSDNNPRVIGFAPDYYTVAIYTTPTCTGAPLATGDGATFSSSGIQVSVPPDSTSVFRATSTDDANNTSPCSSDFLLYQEISTVAAPQLAATVPASPAADTHPAVTGFAPPETTINLYLSADCTGAVAATSSAAQLGGGGIAITVPAMAISTISAAATDFLGNVSECSNAISYVESSAPPPDDRTPPSAPRLASTSPPSPSNVNSFTVQGSAEAGSIVRLYRRADCSGRVLAAGDAAQLALGGLAVSVADDSVTEIHATATDAAGNRSHCSATSVTYIEDSTAPRARVTYGPAFKTRNRRPVFRFADRTEDSTARFLCKLDRRRFFRCSSPKRFRRLGRRRHTLWVKAVDAAGNRQAGATTRRFRIVGPRARARR